MSTILKNAMAGTAVMALMAAEESNAAGGDTNTQTDVTTTDSGSTGTDTTGGESTGDGNTGTTETAETITRPKPGSMSGLVWDTADELYKARVAAGFEHPIPLSSEVSEIYMTIPGAKDPTCRAQFARWVRFNGFEQILKDRKAAERPTKNVDPAVAAEKAKKKAEREEKKKLRDEKRAARAEADKAKADAVSAFKAKIAEQAASAVASKAAEVNAKNEADSKEVPESVTEGTDPAVIESIKKRNAKNK